MVPVVIVYFLLHLQRGNTNPTESDNSPLNVGTVLFYGDKRSCWTNEDIALLQSRRILQDVLPPIDLAQVNDEKYVQSLLKYFDRAFAVVKRKANDRNSQIVSRALADTLGGYMKYWALPVSRYGYYGGTISYESAKKLTDYYEDIKEFLTTDGYSWRPADETVYKSMNFRITRAPEVEADPKRRIDACKGLNFYRTATSELSIPMPHINWEYKPPVMMIPMQKNSLVSLQAPESAYILYNFYMDAQNCLLSEQNLKQKNEFDTRFHRWVSTEVLPHLKEDTLYVAFGSVFRLLNGSREWLSPYEQKVIVFPESNMIRTFDDNTIACKMNNMIRRLPIFWTALLVLWCGPCILYFYFKNLKVPVSHGGPGGGNGNVVGNGNDDVAGDGNGGGRRVSKPTVTMATETFPRTTELKRHRKRSSKRSEQSYPCEILYTCKKVSEQNDKSPKSFSVNSSKTSSNYKSKTSELLHRVSHVNSVHSNNFERELEDKISHPKSTKILKSGEASSKKLQNEEQPQAKSDNSITESNLKEGDHLKDMIDYYSSTLTKSNDLISEDLCVEMPESLSTIVQEDSRSRTFTRSTREIQSEISSTSTISVRSFPYLAMAVNLAPLAETPPSYAKKTPQLTDSTMLPLADTASQLADETPKLAEITPQLAAGTVLQQLQLGELTHLDIETPDSSSPDRKDEKKRSRIPQRRKSKFNN